MMYTTAVQWRQRPGVGCPHFRAGGTAAYRSAVFFQPYCTVPSCNPFRFSNDTVQKIECSIFLLFCAAEGWLHITQKETPPSHFHLSLQNHRSVSFRAFRAYNRDCALESKQFVFFSHTRGKSWIVYLYRRFDHGQTHRSLPL